MSFMVRGLLALCIAAFLAAPALAEKRVALIVANAAYKGATLENPTVDAGLVEAALGKVGFKVEVVKDADLDGFDAALRRFGETAKGADIALFYFAGHGFAVNEGLKPISILMSTSADVAKGSERQLRGNGIPLDDIVQELAGQAKATLIFVDACRNDPRISRAVGGRGRGLSRIEPVRGNALMIGLSTRLGDTAADGEAGKGSPFARAFAANIDAPGLRIDDAFRQIRAAVSAETDGKQLPDIVQDDLPNGAIVLAAADTDASTRPPTVDSKLVEAGQIWPILRDSKDAAELEAFRQRYAGTFYAELAAERLKRIAPPQSKPQDLATVVPATPPIPPSVTGLAAGCERLATPPAANGAAAAPASDKPDTAAAVAACKQAMADAVPQLVDSVVGITVTKAVADKPEKATSRHSGFIVDPSGYIVTNNHIVDGAETIEVIFTDGTKLAAKLTGRDAKVDLAVLKVEPSTPLKSVKFGDSSAVRVGDWALALGNPTGNGSNMTVEVVLALNFDLNAGPYDAFTQTDVAIAIGEVGGPLFNAAGEVIGINTAIMPLTNGKGGNTFVVPSTMAVPLINQLIQFGEVRRGWLGVRIQAVTDDIAKALGMEKSAGALVAGIDERGPAKPAGLEIGDVILKFGDQDVVQMRDLPRAVANAEIGKAVDVTILRKGKQEVKQVALARLDEARPAVKAEPEQPAAPETSATAKALGMVLSGITSELREKYKFSSAAKGIVVTSVDTASPAKDKLKEGDLILEVAQKVPSTPAALAKQIEALRKAGKKTVLVLLSNEVGDVRFVALKLE